jgi:hypothetical protein
LMKFVELHMNRIKSDSKLFDPFAKYFLNDEPSRFSELSQRVVSYINRIYGCK